MSVPAIFTRLSIRSKTSEVEAMSLFSLMASCLPEKGLWETMR